MINKISFKNLKCYNDFTLEGIKPITLISGENNTGKSSLLEGIFLFFDWTSPDCFAKIARFRGISDMPRYQGFWESAFSDMDMTKTMEIALAVDADSQKLIFFKDGAFKYNTMPSSVPDEIKKMLSVGADPYALAVKFESENMMGEGHYILGQNGIISAFQEPVQSLSPIHYIGPHVEEHPNLISEWFGHLEIVGKKNIVVEALKLFDRRIVDLSTIVVNGTGNIYVDFGNNKKQSVKTMGDGINKLLLIILIILCKPHAVILLDEVENGFHYSLFPKIWELLGTVASENNCQIFATTHSYECISGAIEGIKKIGKQDEFCYVRLANKGEGIVPNVFSSELLEYALSSEMEVR